MGMHKTVLVLLLILSWSLLANVGGPQTMMGGKGNEKRWAIEVHEDLGSKVTEADFYEIIGKIYSLYQNNEMNRNLVVGIQDWKIPFFSAWAFDTGEEFTINFWGGFARIPGMTRRAFALTACHEVGHVLGGAPYHTIRISKTMSAEGQADFFATAFCFKKYLETFGEEEVAVDLSPYALDKCRTKFSDERMREYCFSTAKAGQDLAAVLTFLKPLEVADYSSPSDHVVEETLFNSYPTIQCRLDTYLVGALADYPLKENEDSLKPACWFKQ